MAESNRMLSEVDSADLVHVSVDTIRKYTECGLLTTESHDGKKLYREIDIKTMFYGRDPGHQTEESRVAVETITEQSVTAQNVLEQAVLEQAVVEKSEGLVDPLPLSEQRSTATEISSSEEEIIEPLDGAVSHQQPIDQIKPSLETVFLGETEKRATDTEHETVQQVVLPVGDSQPEALLQVSLPSSSELIEINKGLRQQIEMLREERDWLRERVEKLETRSDREQMLLLSESENLRSAISLARAPFWKRALPWLQK